MKSFLVLFNQACLYSLIILTLVVGIISVYLFSPIFGHQVLISNHYPLTPINSLLVIKNQPSVSSNFYNPYQIGDIIAFKLENKTVLRKINDIEFDNKGQAIYITPADSFASEYEAMVPISEVIGVKQMIIPHLGLLLPIFTSGAFWFVIIFSVLGTVLAESAEIIGNFRDQLFFRRRRLITFVQVSPSKAAS